VNPQLVAAVASVLAAVLSGVTLWLSGKRENRRWKRDAVLDSVVDFLDASFEAPSGYSLAKLRADALDEDDRQRLEAAHTKMLHALTRLRVLAPPMVVSLAEQVHKADFDRLTMVLSRRVDDELWESIGRLRNECRDDFVAAVRRDMGLGPSKKVDRDLMHIRYVTSPGKPPSRGAVSAGGS